jgi:hypothetical protein
MGGFNADWLALREPADAAARSTPLTRAVAATLGFGGVVDVLDLAAGTGSNLRYLAGQLPGDQRWLLVDHDPALLGQVPARTAAWASTCGYQVVQDADEMRLRGDRLTCRVATRLMDLGAIDDDLLAGRALVTASALLDLVSDGWLRSLATGCRTSGASVLFALTYDGRIECAPAEPEDEAIRELVNLHQRTDKGFGDAAGPDATDRAGEYFRAAGYEVRREPSDWVLQHGAQELQRQLIEGWAQASASIAPADSRWIRGWEVRRLTHVRRNRSRLVVGHADLAAWIRATTRES